MLDIETDYQRPMSETRPEPVGEIREVEVEGKKFKIGVSLHKDLEVLLKETLSHNIDPFAWSVVDMPDIDPDFFYHHLTIDVRMKLVV